MASKYNDGVLSRVAKCKKALVCFMEKIPVFDKLCSGMSYSDTGHIEFNMSEPTIYTETEIYTRQSYVLVS